MGFIVIRVLLLMICWTVWAGYNSTTDWDIKQFVYDIIAAVKLTLVATSFDLL